MTVYHSNLNDNRQIISRKEALAQGRDTYFLGADHPCIHGHVSNRYVSNGKCCCCRLDSEARMRNAASNKRWREATPDYQASQDGWKAAKRRGAVLPPHFSRPKELIEATLPFYAQARRMTERTGTAFHVDHIVPLNRGGTHEPSNLRVVTAEFNRFKRSYFDEEIVEMISAGTWKGPTDAHTMMALLRSMRAVVARLEREGDELTQEAA